MYKNYFSDIFITDFQTTLIGRFHPNVLILNVFRDARGLVVGSRTIGSRPTTSDTATDVRSKTWRRRNGIGINAIVRFFTWWVVFRFSARAHGDQQQKNRSETRQVRNDQQHFRVSESTTRGGRSVRCVKRTRTYGGVFRLSWLFFLKKLFITQTGW